MNGKKICEKLGAAYDTLEIMARRIRKEGGRSSLDILTGVAPSDTRFVILGEAGMRQDYQDLKALVAEIGEALDEEVASPVTTRRNGRPGNKTDDVQAPTGGFNGHTG